MLGLLRGFDERDAASRDDTFGNCRFGGIYRVFNLQFQILHLGLGRRADANHRHSATELRNPFVNLFNVIFGIRLLALFAQLRHARVNLALLSLSSHNRGLILGRNHAMRVPQYFKPHGLKLEPDFLGNHLRANCHGNVLEHLFFAVAVTGRLNPQHIKTASQFVQHESRERFTLNILRNHHHIFLSCLREFFKKRENLLDAGNLFVGNQNRRVLHYRLHTLRIRNHVRRHIPLVKLQTLHHL